MSFLRQQADRGDLNVSYLSKYILNMMVLLCAPVRDEAVQRRESISDPVRLLRCDTNSSLLTCSGPSWEGLAAAVQPLSRRLLAPPGLLVLTSSKKDLWVVLSSTGPFV